MIHAIRIRIGRLLLALKETPVTRAHEWWTFEAMILLAGGARAPRPRPPQPRPLRQRRTVPALLPARAHVAPSLPNNVHRDFSR